MYLKRALVHGATFQKSMIYPKSMLLIITIMQMVFGLNETLDVTGGTTPQPPYFNNVGFQQLYNISTLRSSTLLKGQLQLFFFRLYSYDGVASIFPPKNYTSSFGVTIDDYTELIIPNCNY